MLCYWILRSPDGSPAGLVRLQNDRVRLSLSAPVAGRFTLFSDTAAVQIAPDSETVLPGAAALLGTDGDRMPCFAVSDHAAPLAAYRSRLSHIYTIENAELTPTPKTEEPASDLSSIRTIESEPSPGSERIADNLSHNSTIDRSSISETARDAHAFSLLLQRAESFFAAYEGDPVENMVQKEDISVAQESGIDLFSQEYPGARWRFVEGADVLPHYEGTWRQPNGQTLHILAVRGHAAPRPPRALFGFTRFLRDRDGTGYWLRLTPLP